MLSNLTMKKGLVEFAKTTDHCFTLAIIIHSQMFITTSRYIHATNNLH